MGTQIIKLDSINRCNKFFCKDTQHPLVSLIDLTTEEAGDNDLLQLDFYSIWLKEASCCGCKYYDFKDATLSFSMPGRPIHAELWSRYREQKGRLLCFHPDLLCCSVLKERFPRYTFFHYRPNEALHLSCREKGFINRCLDGLAEELAWETDEHSCTLITDRILLLLDYCTRYYHRQFITRHDANQEILNQAEQLTENYFLTGQVPLHGLPDAEYYARQVGMSSAYFDDLLRYETGKDTAEYVNLKRMDMACKLLRRTDKGIARIADELGFPSVQLFSNVFKRITGCTPGQYRLPLN